MKRICACTILLLAASGCDGWKTQPKAVVAAEEKRDAARNKQFRQACASQATYDRLKQLAFDEAVRVRKAGSPLLDQLAVASVVRMEEPVVKSRDDGLGVTVCSGRLILELPPGVSDAFDGERRLSADVEYAAQSAADGSGLIFQMDGAEPIIYRLAAVALNERPVVLAEQDARAELPPPAVDAILPPAPAPSPAPRAAPTPRSTPSPRPTPAAASPPQQNVSRPSFNCRYARTRGERMVCASDRLAAKDRAMASRYYDAMNEVSAAGRRELRATRDRFLAYRDRCRDEACIAQAYDGRVREIEDIAAAF